MPSRRDVLSDALGIGLVTASPSRADEPRSIHGQSTANSGRTTDNTSLTWDLFLALIRVHPPSLRAGIR
jgi:hypothetical protein